MPENKSVLTGFKGLASSSSILADRQKNVIEKYKSAAIDDIMEHARARALKCIRDSGGGAGTEIDREIKDFIEQECPAMTYTQKDDIARQILDELRGYGPLSDLLSDPGVSDIICVNYTRILYEKNGVLRVYQKDGQPVCFRSRTLLQLLIERLCMMGRGRVDESRPYAVVNVEGARVAVTIPPVTLEPTVAIRKFVAVPTLEDLAASGSLTPEAAEFMKACSAGRRNLVFAGGMGTGKTTMIAVLGRYFGADEMPVLVEGVRECPLEHPNLRILVARPPNIEGKGRIEISKLLEIALTMRASRVLVSEAKGGESFYCLQAMNIGHAGSMFTFHANSAQDALFRRLPSMVMMSPELSDQYDPMRLIGNSVHFIAMLEITDRGVRRFREISEVRYDGERCEAVPVFVRRGGGLVPTGHVPEAHLEQMREFGADLPRSVFLPDPELIINF
jgi:pilus assembly protein CpaF